MLNMPESMDACVYFTRRVLEGDGKAIAWVSKEDCPECGKGKMGKPRDKGKVKIRAKEYVCPECNHTVEKEAYEETLTCNIQFTCPACKKEGEASVPFQRKSYKGVKAVVFTCDCGEKLGITKKMAKTKR
jgi:hypothetical protein